MVAATAVAAGILACCRAGPLARREGRRSRRSGACTRGRVVCPSSPGHGAVRPCRIQVVRRCADAALPGGTMSPFTTTWMVAATTVAAGFQPPVEPGLWPGGRCGVPVDPAPVREEAGPPLFLGHGAVRPYQGQEVRRYADAALPGGTMPPFTATRMVAATTVAAGFQPAVEPGLWPGGPGVAKPAARDALQTPGGVLPPATVTRRVAATVRCIRLCARYPALCILLFVFGRTRTVRSSNFYTANFPATFALTDGSPKCLLFP